MVNINFHIVVPENDDVMYNVEKLRSHLGWTTELPRHGPDCRKAMETISDIPKLNPQVTKHNVLYKIEIKEVMESFLPA